MRRKAIDILSELVGKGITFSTKEGKLQCHAARGAITPDIQNTIRTYKEEIIELIEQDQGSNGTIIPKERPGFLPLSFAQERLWYLYKLGQGDQYHMPSINRLSGAVDFNILKKAFDFIVQRHESLRTSFKEHDGKPYQFVHDTMEVGLLHIDTKAEEKVEEDLQNHISKFVHQPFDLEEGPLFRLLVVEMSSDEYLLGFCMHHIISDGWSIGVLSQELQSVYQSYASGQQPNLPPLPIQYADYTLWQKEFFNEERLHKELGHWQEHLKNYEDLAMPTDHARPAQLSGKGRYIWSEMDGKLSGNIRKFGLENDVTLFNILLTTVYVILHFYSRQDDICIGMPIANRRNNKLESLIGFFANTVVTRVHINPEDTWQALLMKVRKELIRSQDHQDVPFEKVVEAVQPERDLSRTPIFQVLANYVNVSTPNVNLQDENASSVDFEYESSKFDLNFTFSGGGGEPVGMSIEYSLDLYNDDAIERMSKQYLLLLNSFLENPAQPISETTWLGVEEEEILKRFKAPLTKVEDDQTLHDLFYQQALVSGKEVAVCYQNESITYAELEDRSRKLALFMQSGGQSKNLVAICMHRSIDTVVAIMAILRSGAGYVPIDPGYPNDRIGHIISDSGVSWIITQSDLRDKIQLLASSQVEHIVCVDQQWSDIDASEGELNVRVTKDDVAYVIYTSGTTGKPKAVLQRHGTIANLINYQRKEISDLTCHKNVSQFASSSFDVSVQETFYALLNGYTLHVVPEPTKTSTDDLIRFVQDQKINVLYLPTGYLTYFCHASTTANHLLQDLERIIVAGEALKITEETRTFFIRNKHIRLENHYGPSETHVVSNLVLPANAEEWPKVPSIGKPIENLQAYVLLGNKRMAPIGVPGELYVSGEGLAQGYLNAPELNKDRFLPDSFGGNTCYKTGDLVRWMPDGNLQFLGRLDGQVKIRGFRVELGEVEMVIMKHPQVTNAAVIVKNLNNSPHLIGFYESQETVSQSELKSHLQTLLPDYMVPTVLMSLDALPLNHNGKMDKKALQRHEITIKSDTEFVAPKNDIERKLVEVWKDILKAERVGVSDNFFTLGGHSLLSVQLINKINQELRLENKSVQVIDILKYPTISQMAVHIGAKTDKLNESSHIIELRSGVQGAIPIFIIPGLPGLSESYHDMANELAGDGPVYGLQMKGVYGEEPAHSIEDMAAHNLSLIKDLTPHGEASFYAHSYGGMVLCEMLRQLESQNFCVNEVVFLDCGLMQSADLEKESQEHALSFCHLLLANTGVGVNFLDNRVETLLDEYEVSQWKYKLGDLFARYTGIDSSTFVNLWDLVKAAMLISYQPNKNLDFTMKLVIADSSNAWLKPDIWQPHFRKVNTTYTTGNHFSIIKEPECSSWIQNLKTDSKRQLEEI